MRSAWVTMPLLFVLSTLAGCADDGEPSDTESGPVVITDPEDYTYVGNASFDNGGHLHDYWGGQDRLTVVDASAQVVVGLYGAEPLDVLVVRPEAGDVVPQGTASVEVTTSWQDNMLNRYGKVELWVKTASENEAVPVQELENGGTIVLPTAHANNDLPHQVLSAWEFHLVVYLPADGTFGRFQADVEMQVEAVRGLDIPVYPAHPDQWEGRDEIPLVEMSDETLWQTEDPILWSCGGPGCFYWAYNALDGALVPRDATRVVVTLSWQGTTPSTLGLRYHGADAWDLQTPQPVEDADGRRVYEIAVEPEMGDGPYSLQSLWEFWIFIDDPTMVYSGAYSLHAVVLLD